LADGLPMEERLAEKQAASEVCANVPTATEPPPPPQLQAAEGDIKKYVEFDSIEEALETGDTKLVKGSFLLDLFDRRRVLPRRQAVPDRAFWEPGEIIELARRQKGPRRRKPIVALSYCWLTPEHPDPEGEQLATLCKVVRVCLMYFRSVCGISDIAIFLDWCSLFQHQGGGMSGEQRNAFKRGLRNVNLWYAHVETQVWLLTKLPQRCTAVKAFDERGWPVFERGVSGLITHYDAFFDIGSFTEEGCRSGDTKQICNTSRQPPLTPLEFTVVLETKSFTSGADHSIVQTKYDANIPRGNHRDGQAAVRCLGWADSEITILAKALPFCMSLKELHLSSNQIGDAGAIVLADAIGKSSTMEALGLWKNQINEAGAIALADGIAKSTTMQIVDFRENQIGEAGAVAIAEATAKSPTMYHADLAENPIGAEGRARVKSIAGDKVDCW